MDPTTDEEKWGQFGAELSQAYKGPKSPIVAVSKRIDGVLFYVYLKKPVTDTTIWQTGPIYLNLHFENGNVVGGGLNVSVNEFHTFMSYARS